MPQLTQTDCVIYYVTHDGLKGHTCHHGHTVKTCHDFLLVTEDRDEWEAWGSSECCDCDCDHDCDCDCDCGCEVCGEDCSSSTSSEG